MFFSGIVSSLLRIPDRVYRTEQWDGWNVMLLQAKL